MHAVSVGADQPSVRFLPGVPHVEPVSLSSDDADSVSDNSDDPDAQHATRPISPLDKGEIMIKTV